MSGRNKEMRKNGKALNKTHREMEHEREKLEKEEHNLELAIQRAAKKGDKQTCTILAKQLVNLRKTKTRSYGASAKVSAVKTQAKTMQSTKTLATAMGSKTKGMVAMNKQMSTEKVDQITQKYGSESAKSDRKQESMDDTLEDLLTESGDEEEETRAIK
ncbi:charged multivesicular body protein 2b-like isoform X2 [Antedon mediterranea]|uniref:charged multivesicular body protein 2b-like isoform X2 n=1 Tax=Antedon mediterranea TaxID=105859 RepID=UPI003AF572F3